MPSELQKTADRFRQELLANEARASHAMAKAYTDAYAGIDASLQKLTRHIETEQRAGRPITQAWLLRQARYRDLLAQAKKEMEWFAGYAEETILVSQRATVSLAQTFAEKLVGLQSGEDSLSGWNRLPTDAVESIVGHLQDGSPLKTLFTGLGELASAKAKATLLTSVAAGWNPRKTASALKEQFGGDLTRSLVVARTETLRAHREASRHSYLANSDLIESYVWMASLSGRTCAACLAMHGKEFPLSEPFGTHPNCRCTMVPKLREDTNPIEESGDNWLLSQDDALQSRVLGSEAAGAAFRAGEVQLADFMQERTSDKWGVTRSALSSKAALANAKGKKIPFSS